MSYESFLQKRKGNYSKKLKNDSTFYNEISNKAKELYKKEFTKEKMIKILNNE